ncbi:MAG: hypothetical protein DI563_25865 [Variovorax paradoxus]|uniref:Uncharacterized protein n=1 Tax=Variovorax paradoxus TaxID=34073 RepID=A0A2W5PHN8_VARPD|nr:MAG: hypothetical protein DI563_25865 [Variovorax paradoxus]
MEPMKPMQPMKPMKPMEPMEPMQTAAKDWWPEGLHSPASSGSQNGMRYAYFAAERRLVVERDGAVAQYDTGEHRIEGVAQSAGSDGPKFSSRDGEIALDSLRKVA